MELDYHFDASKIRVRAENIVNELSIEERVNWTQHPLTKALLLTLKGDYLDHHAVWENGGFTSESSDGTAQQNAKALGAIEAIRLIANYIEDIQIDDQG